MHVLEGLQRHAAHGALLHGGEHGVAHLAEAGAGKPHETVADDEADRDGQHLARSRPVG